MRRIICPNPNHKESTASCVVYPTHAYCFGCATRFELTDIGLTSNEPKKQPEDISASLAYIASLPKANVRGISLPVDDRYFYIVWPDFKYYKKRNLRINEGAKYRCPTGISKPLYVPRQTKGQDRLVITEGELNALSLAQIPGDYDICSPGGCGDFKNERYMSFYLTYKKFCLILDKDAAGMGAAIALRAMLLKHSPYIDVRFVEKDFNDVLCQDGKEKLVEMSQRLFTE